MREQLVSTMQPWAIEKLFACGRFTQTWANRAQGGLKSDTISPLGKSFHNFADKFPQPCCFTFTSWQNIKKWSQFWKSTATTGRLFYLGQHIQFGLSIGKNPLRFKFVSRKQLQRGSSTKEKERHRQKIWPPLMLNRTNHLGSSEFLIYDKPFLFALCCETSGEMTVNSTTLFF